MDSNTTSTTVATPHSLASSSKERAAPLSSRSSFTSFSSRGIDEIAYRQIRDQLNGTSGNAPNAFSTAALRRQEINQLPRSVRWRLSLGLLTTPLPERDLSSTSILATSSTAAALSSILSSRGRGTLGSRAHSTIGNRHIEVPKNQANKSSAGTSDVSKISQFQSAPVPKSALFKSIETTNALKLRLQRSRYEDLEKKHYWSATPMSIIGNTSNVTGGGTNHGTGRGGGSIAGGAHHVARGDDPLSALLQSNQNSENSNTREDGSRTLFGGKGVFGVSTPMSRRNRLLRGKSRDQANSKDSDLSGHSAPLIDSIMPEGREVGAKVCSKSGDESTSLLANSSSSHASQERANFATDSREGVFPGGGNMGIGKKGKGEKSQKGSSETPACKGSRWADFYSTREVLDVIEKDLNRLPSDHYKIYHEWRMKCKEWKLEQKQAEILMLEKEKNDSLKRPPKIGEKNADGKKPPDKENQLQIQCSSSPPLSLRSRWNPGGLSSSLTGGITTGGNNENNSSEKPLSTPSSNTVTFHKWNFPAKLAHRSAENSGNIGGNDGFREISSDLSYTRQTRMQEEEKQLENEKAEKEISVRERVGRLSQILFVYAREHPEVGYRQGMHEVLSNVLLVLEMDLLEAAIAEDQQKFKEDDMSLETARVFSNAEKTSIGCAKFDNSSLLARSGSFGGGMAGVDSSGNIVVVRLLDPNWILQDAFSLFECIMTALAPAYDAVPVADDVTADMLAVAKSERGESPMEAMTSSIVSKIRYVARDETLFGHVLYMPVPPQLYFAKWVRLMFGREVSGGIKNIMRLWDAFFDLAAVTASLERHAGIPVSMALMNVLKTAAASMIILIRDKLLTPSAYTGEPDPNDGIGYLMNYPPIEDIGPLVDTISNLLVKERKLSKQYQASMRPTNRQTLSTQNEQDMFMNKANCSVMAAPKNMLNESGKNKETSNPNEMSHIIDHPLQTTDCIATRKRNIVGDSLHMRSEKGASLPAHDPPQTPLLSSDLDESDNTPSREIFAGKTASLDEGEVLPKVIRTGVTCEISPKNGVKTSELPRFVGQDNNLHNIASPTQASLKFDFSDPSATNVPSSVGSPTDKKPSLGHFAAGLFGFGSKTVDPASSNRKKTEVPRQVVNEHPLQANGEAVIPKSTRSGGNLFHLLGSGAGKEENDSAEGDNARNFRGRCDLLDQESAVLVDLEPCNEIEEGKGAPLYVRSNSKRDKLVRSCSFTHGRKCCKSNVIMPKRNSDFQVGYDEDDADVYLGLTNRSTDESHNDQSDTLSGTKRVPGDLQEDWTSMHGNANGYRGKVSNDGDSTIDKNHSRRCEEHPDESKLTFSRSLGTSIQKTPKELALKLEKSVTTLMKHFNNQISAREKDISNSSLSLEKGSPYNGMDSPSFLPGEIWEAMAGIDLVRKELLLQDAINKLGKYA